MEFVSPTIAATVLVALSLWIQCAGMTALINWGLAYLAHKQRLSLVHSTVLMVRVTSLMIGLHIAQILRHFIAGCVFPVGDSLSTSRRPAIPRSATVMLSSPQRGGAWALSKR
jgi:hypothetical protein